MSRLYEKTKELLRTTTVPIQKISVDTNINVYTLIRLKGVHKSIPAVDTCEKIYTYLSGKQLEV